MTISGGSPPMMKKARVGLPMEVELALPFLSATEDLSKFASISKACRDAARESYQNRIYNTTPLPPFVDKSSIDNNRLGQPRIFSANEKGYTIYQDPWWAKKQRKEQAWMNAETNLPLTFREDGSWTLEEGECSDEITPPQCLMDYKLIFPARYHELFNNNDDPTDLVHWSIVDSLLLVILCRWTDRGDEIFNDEDTRKQLFAVLYELPSSSSSSSMVVAGSQQQEQQLLPLFCQELTKPIDRNNYGSLDNIYFGNGERSRNGKVVAIVTALPLGNEDNVDDDEVRETAAITVYEITKTSLEKRSVLEVPIGDRTGFPICDRTGQSMLTMTISNSGELLSVNTTQDESDSEYGDWVIHHVTTAISSSNNTASTTTMPPPPLLLVQMEEVRYRFLSHLFTPDNELLIVLPDDVDGKSYFEETEIPDWLAKRIIVTQANESFFDDDDDDEDDNDDDDESDNDDEDE